MSTIILFGGVDMSTDQIILKTHKLGDFYYPIHIVLKNSGDADISELYEEIRSRWGRGVKDVSKLPQELKKLLEKNGASKIKVLKSKNDFDLSVSKRVKKIRRGPFSLDGHIVTGVSDRIRRFQVDFILKSTNAV